MFALVYDISYISRREYATVETHLRLDDYGIPVSFYRSWYDTYFTWKSMM
jgi:hypothetical protein